MEQGFEINRVIERYKEILQKEGFKFIYEWEDKPGVNYTSHAHKGKVAFYIAKGSIEMTMNGKIYELKIGDRMDVPPGVSHVAKVGMDGCIFVVGEEIEGDS